jgi:DNA-binding transcriptional LysR family regulator
MRRVTTGRRVDRFVSARLRPRRHFACRRSFPPMPRRIPKVGLIVTTGTSAGLVADVLEHRLDGAFVSGPVQHPDLAEEAIFCEELMLVTAPALRRMDDLDRERDLKIIVFGRGCSYRQHLEDLLARRGIQTVPRSTGEDFNGRSSLCFGRLEVSKAMLDKVRSCWPFSGPLSARCPVAVALAPLSTRLGGV